MHVLLIRSDLPESPEVLLLCGLLKDNRGWIPSPEVVVCKLVKLWAWVAEHGAPDSDSVDYLVPSGLVEALEAQLGCPGLVAAMCDPAVDWCARRESHVAFCRFAEWNGPDALRRRGDSVRARRSRERSQARILRAGNTTPERETAPKSSAKSSAKSGAKAHAKRDACHGSRAPSIDVDVDVSKDSSKKTSSSTSSPPGKVDRPPPDAAAADPPMDLSEGGGPTAAELYARIRAAFRSPASADDAAVNRDRDAAWKAAVVVAGTLGEAWLDRVCIAAAKQKLHRPPAYLWQAVERGLTDRGLSAKAEFARIATPPAADLAAMETGPPRIEPAAKQRPDPERVRDCEMRRFRVELIRRGVTGDALVAACDDFDRQLSEKLSDEPNERRSAAASV